MSASPELTDQHIPVVSPDIIVDLAAQPVEEFNRWGREFAGSQPALTSTCVQMLQNSSDGTFEGASALGYQLVLSYKALCCALGQSRADTDPRAVLPEVTQDDIDDLYRQATAQPNGYQRPFADMHQAFEVRQPHLTTRLEGHIRTHGLPAERAQIIVAPISLMYSALEWRLHLDAFDAQLEALSGGSAI